MLLLASRVAACTGTLSGLRYLDETLAVLDGRTPAQTRSPIWWASGWSGPLRLKARIDPERMPPVLREAEILRSQLRKTSSDLAASTSR